MGDSVTIRLRDSWEDYPLIPVRTDVRSFFPPYKERFTLIIEDMSIRTNVTGRKSNITAEEGDPEAGTYLRSGIRDLQESHPEIYGGDELTIEKVSSEEYEITDW
jgi:hypothetical protein